MNILVTGSCGFIGFHCSLFFLKNGYRVHGIDNLNNYYSVKLKLSRNKKLKKYKNYFFSKIDIANEKKIFDYFKNKKIDIILNLAAQAGVQYSLQNPKSYIDSNIIGFQNIISLALKKNIKKIFYASSSSVYGDQKIFPLQENMKLGRQLSLYAQSKYFNEIMAHNFSLSSQIKFVGLRFFTVYGPYGRPDMSIYKFVNSVFHNKQVILYNSGNHYRDFTNVNDVALSVFKLINSKITKRHDIFNIGNSKPIKILNIIEIIKKITKKKIKIKNKNKNHYDVLITHSNSKKLFKQIKFKPEISIENGLIEFIKWFKDYHKI